jgi:hypothetical protein
MLDRLTAAKQRSIVSAQDTIDATSFKLRRTLLESRSVYEIVEAWDSRQAEDDHGVHDEEGDVKYVGQAVERLYAMLPIIRGLKVQRILSLERLQPLDQNDQGTFEQAYVRASLTGKLLQAVKNADLRVLTPSMHFLGFLGVLLALLTVISTHSRETGAQTTDDRMLWPTLLLALVACGINTMLQSAGSVCNSDPSLGPMLRSSPIVCMIDACHLLYKLMHYYFDNGKDERRSLRKAHLRLLQQRYQQWDHGQRARDHGGDNEFRPKDRLELSQRLFRFTFFSLTVAPTVTVFASTGLIWSKIIIGLYLVPMIVVELISSWPLTSTDKAKDFTDDRNSLELSSQPSLFYNSVSLATAFMSYFGARALRDAFGGSHSQFGLYLSLFTVLSWMIPFICAWVLCTVNSSDWRNPNDLILPTPTIRLLSLFILNFVYLTFNQGFPAAFIQTACAGLLTAWVWIQYAPAADRRRRELVDEDEGCMTSRSKVVKLSLAWWFAALHLITAVLYLSCSYDPAGTSKPAWTKHFN